MSNFMNSYYSNLNDLTQINATDIQTESINTKALYINNTLFDPSSNITSAQFTDLSNNVSTNITNIATNTANISTNTTDITNLKTKTTNQSFSGNTTSWSGSVVFPTSSIDSTSINNSSFVGLTGNQTVAGNKQFNAITRFLSNIRCDAGLTVNNNALTITNSELMLIPSIGALNTKSTNISFVSNITTISNTTNLSNINFTGNINNTFTKTQFDNGINFSKDLTSSAQTQINSINTTLSNYVLTTALNTTLSNYVLTTALNTTLSNYVLTTALNTTLSPINTDISTLQTKTQYISSTLLNTTISNTTNVTDLFISANINGFSKGDLNNVITQCSSLTSNCQNQITQAQNTANSAQNKADTAKTAADNAQGTANTAFALAGTAQGTAVGAGALAGLAQTTANGASAGLVTTNTRVDGIELDINALELKTTQISYNLATSRTTINQTLYSPFLEIGNLESGFNQTSTDQITLAGLLRCNNRVEINNTLELVNNNNIIVEGIINQDNANPPNSGVNKFEAGVTMNGNVIMAGGNTTINSANTQIGVNSTNNLNCNATASFGGDITMLTNKNLRLKNIVPILLDDIYFGGEAGVHTNDDVIFNMKVTTNQPLQINNTCQIGTTINRNTLTSYTTTALLDSNTGMTLTAPSILIPTPLINIGQNGITSITLNGSIVQIGQTLGINYLYGNTYVQNLYSTTGVIGAVGNVFQQF